MRFPVTLSMDHAPEFFDRFMRIIGPEPWLKRHRELLEQLRTNPLLRDLVVRRHSIELTIGGLLEARNSSEDLPVDFGVRADYATFAFLAPAVLIYSGLSETGKTRLAGILRGGLKTEQGLGPFQSEVETATQLMHAGFDVTFRDLEGEPGFDFLAVRDGVELEVECKSVSGDLGRQVHERQMVALAKQLLEALKRTVNGLTGGYLLLATLPGRLPGDPTVLECVAANVKATVTGTVPPSPEVCKTEVRTFDVAASPFAAHRPDDVTPEKVRQFVNEQLGSRNASIATLFAPNKRAIVVVVESERGDQVVRELLRTLKRAAKGQFSRQRPAVLVVQFLDLGPEAMLELARHGSTDPAKASALQLVTNMFFASPQRAHMHTIVYRSHGWIVTAAADVQERGPTYSFRNPSHPYAEDPRYRPFAVGAS